MSSALCSLEVMINAPKRQTAGLFIRRLLFRQSVTVCGCPVMAFSPLKGIVAGSDQRKHFCQLAALKLSLTLVTLFVIQFDTFGMKFGQLPCLCIWLMPLLCLCFVVVCVCVMRCFAAFYKSGDVPLVREISCRKRKTEKVCCRRWAKKGVSQGCLRMPSREINVCFRLKMKHLRQFLTAVPKPTGNASERL